MGKSQPMMSALPPLFPTRIIDADTGEIIVNEIFARDLTALVGFVQQDTARIWAATKDSLEQVLRNVTAKAPAEIGRQAGIVSSVKDLPRDVKAKSRIERLIRYQLVTHAKSYYESPNLLKRDPSFGEYLNLGAIDNNMAGITVENGQLTLKFKCWLGEYVLFFEIPDYILARNIQKITLPVIKKLGDDWAFLFASEETPSPLITKSDYVAGIDLGRTMPYTLVIVHERTRNRVAQYTASSRLMVLTAKRDRLNKELGFLQAKSFAYTNLGIDNTVLEQERALTRGKRNRLLNKITWLIATEIEAHLKIFNPRMVSIEDLAWVNPRHGMSRWTHSKDQLAITHKLTRSGFLTKKVNPRNTSQNCHKCSAKLTYQPGKRLVVCSSCSLTLDRDLNAAVNITIRPLPKRSKGNNCTIQTEVMAAKPRPSKRQLTTVVRNTS